jgi:hypothetical protein
MSKILLVGATGYVGGSVLSQLLASTEASLQNLTFDILVRREPQAELLRSIYRDRIKTVYWAGLDDIQSIEAIASRYDIIVNAGSGFITAGAKAFINGLASRVEADLPAPWLLHLSGCTNLVDPSQQPFEWNDERDGQAIFQHMKSRHSTLRSRTPRGLQRSQCWRPQQSEACKRSACRHRASLARALVFRSTRPSHSSGPQICRSAWTRLQAE